MNKSNKFWVKFGFKKSDARPIAIQDSDTLYIYPKFATNFVNNKWRVRGHK